MLGHASPGNSQEQLGTFCSNTFPKITSCSRNLMEFYFTFAFIGINYTPPLMLLYPDLSYCTNSLKTYDLFLFITCNSLSFKKTLNHNINKILTTCWLRHYNYPSSFVPFRQLVVGIFRNKCYMFQDIFKPMDSERFSICVISQISSTLNIQNCQPCQQLCEDQEQQCFELNAVVNILTCLQGQCNMLMFSWYHVHHVHCLSLVCQPSNTGPAETDRNVIRFPDVSS